MTIIILPVKNEEETIQTTALELFSWCSENIKDEYHIVFIDDNSTDNTIQNLKLTNNKNISVIENDFDEGKGSALKSAFLFSSIKYHVKDEDLFIFMDGDGQIAPNQINRFLNLMKLYDADAVIGNKRSIYSIHKVSVARKIVSLIYNTMIRSLFDIRYEDTQCGIKLFKRHALKKVIRKITIKKFAFDFELIVALKESEMVVIDCPVKVRKQKNRGSVSFKSLVETFFDTMNVFIKFKRGFYLT